MTVGLALLALLIAVGGPDGLTAPSGGTPDSAASRLREGTVLRDTVGEFQVDEGRLTFVLTEPPRRYVALENRCLERVERLLHDKGTTLRWSVDGTITEFRGANYLLLKRATVQPTAAAPAADEPGRTAKR